MDNKIKNQILGILLLLLPVIGFSQAEENSIKIEVVPDYLTWTRGDTISTERYICEKDKLETKEEILYEGTPLVITQTYPYTIFATKEVCPDFYNSLQEHQWVYKPVSLLHDYSNFFKIKTVQTWQINGYKVDAQLNGYDSCSPVILEEYEKICKVCLRYEKRKVIQYYRWIKQEESEFEILKGRIRPNNNK